MSEFETKSHSGQPVFPVFHGSRDVIEVLEAAIEEAKAGRLQGVIVCGIGPEGSGWQGAVNDGLEHTWARLQASVDTAQMELLRDGIVGWS